MKARDAERAATLVQALQDMPAVAREAKHNKVMSAGYERRGMQIAICDSSECGADLDATMELDPETGRLILPLVEKIIREELAKLGVEIET